MSGEAPRPLVTVIVPSFNQGRFIRETIESCLAQDYRPLQVLVMDGASRDETVEVLKSFDAPELEWISEPDKGVVDAVNKGLARARGDILSIQSSDDVFLPGAVSAAVEALQAAPDAGLVYGNIELIDEHSARIGGDVQQPFDLGAYVGRLQYVPQPGTFFRRSAMEEAGPWRAQVSYVADADFWMRIALRHKALFLDRWLARYRYHEEQRDTQRARIERDWHAAVSDLIEGGQLDDRQRRQARMGMHLASYRYAAPADWKRRTRALYSALLSYPPALFDTRFPKRELVREPVWAFLSRVKRAMGIRPRGT